MILKVCFYAAILTATASAQVSTNASLTGKYSFREVLLITDGTATVTTTTSGSGTLTFDGNGTYRYRCPDGTLRIGHLHGQARWVRFVN